MTLISLPPHKITELREASTSCDLSLSTTVNQARIASEPTNPDIIFKSEWYDPLDLRVSSSIFEGLTTLEEYDYDGMPITTISFRYTGTTSLWWVIVQYNGFLHPDEIPNGFKLKIPDLSDIKTKLLKSVSRKGEQFTF
jgi:hypothetical protein